jgi:hypothetical protein
MKHFRRSLASWISPDLYEEAEDGMYLRLHMELTRNWLCEFKQVLTVLNHIEKVVDRRSSDGPTPPELSIDHVRKQLHAERHALTHPVDPVLEALYSDAVIERDKLEERVEELLAANSQLLNEMRDWKAKYLPTDRPVEDEVVVDLDAENRLAFAS